MSDSWKYHIILTLFERTGLGIGREVETSWKKLLEKVKIHKKAIYAKTFSLTKKSLMAKDSRRNSARLDTHIDPNAPIFTIFMVLGWDRKHIIPSKFQNCIKIVLIDRFRWSFFLNWFKLNVDLREIGLKFLSAKLSELD